MLEILIPSSSRLIFVSITFAFLIFGGPSLLSGQIKIANLKDPDVVIGCNCTIRSVAEAKKPRSRKLLFVSETGTDEAWMNINGKDTKLKLVKSTESENSDHRVGRQYYKEYTATGIKVRVDYRTTWVCPPLDEACEHSKYAVIITVTKGKLSETLKATGICGC